MKVIIAVSLFPRLTAIQNERMKYLIKINAAEKQAISKKFPRVHIVRTMKSDSKRHHYYCEEQRDVMRFIRELRGEPTRKNRRNGKGAWNERVRTKT